MTREEWLAVLDSEPATPNQRGAIMRECNRLELVDRDERLAVLAAMLGLDGLASTGDLTMGQAGQLVNALQRTRDRAELPEADDGGDEHQADSPGHVGCRDGEPGAAPVSIAEALRRIALILCSASYGSGRGKPIG